MRFPEPYYKSATPRATALRICSSGDLTAKACTYGVEIAADTLRDDPQMVNFLATVANKCEVAWNPASANTKACINGASYLIRFTTAFESFENVCDPASKVVAAPDCRLGAFSLRLALTLGEIPKDQNRAEEFLAKVQRQAVGLCASKTSKLEHYAGCFQGILLGWAKVGLLDPSLVSLELFKDEQSISQLPTWVRYSLYNPYFALAGQAH